MKPLPWVQFAFYRSLHPASVALKKQGGEWRFTGCILGLLLFGMLRPVERLRRVRRER